MLLRSVTKHVKDQNWFAVFLDFFIVVAGILIAFQITNWNEARGDRVAERNYLSALENDAELSVENLNAILSALEEQQVARQKLYEYNIDPNAELSAEALGGLLQASLFNIQRMNITEVSFNDLANSGQLSVIGEPVLIAALQKLEAATVSAQLRQDESLSLTYDYTDPYLINETDMENMINADLVNDGSENLTWIKKRPQSGIEREKAKSVKLKNLVLFRAEVCRGRMVSIKNLISEYETVLALIDARQAKIGSE
jgi:hypothetical protein